MSLLTNIKLGNITNLSDARFAAAAGATYIGFCFDPSNANYIAPIKAKEIIDWVNGSLVVAEFGNQSLAEIRDISDLLNVDVIEVNNNLLPDELLSLGKAIIKKVDLSAFTIEQVHTEIDAYKNVVDAFHVYTSNETQQLDKTQIAVIGKEVNIVYGLDVNSQNATSILDSIKPFAINISGGQEEKAGMKDFDDLNDLLDLLRIEE